MVITFTRTCEERMANSSFEVENGATGLEKKLVFG
jgi:hypothetical protein